MLAIPQSQIDRLKTKGIDDLAVVVADFKVALAAHAKTINVPAPVAADPLIEQIARCTDSKFTVVEDETGLEPSDPESLTGKIEKLNAKIDGLTTRTTSTEKATNDLAARVIIMEKVAKP